MTILSLRPDQWQWQKSCPTFRSSESSILVTVLLDQGEQRPQLRPSKMDTNYCRFSFFHVISECPYIFILSLSLSLSHTHTHTHTQQELNLSFGELDHESALEVADALANKKDIKKIDLNGQFPSNHDTVDVYTFHIVSHSCPCRQCFW